MRLKQVRRSRKFLNFYRAAYGFKPPYHILLDGTAIQTSINTGMEIEKEIRKLLGAPVKIFVTRAVIAELHALGKKFASAARACHKFKILNVPGSAPSEAAESFLQALAEGNPRNLFAFTEDASIQVSQLE